MLARRGCRDRDVAWCLPRAVRRRGSLLLPASAPRPLPCQPWHIQSAHLVLASRKLTGCGGELKRRSAVGLEDWVLVLLLVATCSSRCSGTIGLLMQVGAWRCKLRAWVGRVDYWRTDRLGSRGQTDCVSGGSQSPLLLPSVQPVRSLTPPLAWSVLRHLGVLSSAVAVVAVAAGRDQMWGGCPHGTRHPAVAFFFNSFLPGACCCCRGWCSAHTGKSGCCCCWNYGLGQGCEGGRLPVVCLTRGGGCPLACPPYLTVSVVLVVRCRWHAAARGGHVGGRPTEVGGCLGHDVRR